MDACILSRTIKNKAIFFFLSQNITKSWGWLIPAIYKTKATEKWFFSGKFWADSWPHSQDEMYILFLIQKISEIFLHLFLLKFFHLKYFFDFWSTIP